MQEHIKKRHSIINHAPLLCKQKSHTLTTPRSLLQFLPIYFPTYRNATTN